jgi:hypothetical protein
MARPASIDVTLYRAGLSLLPPAFRRDFAPEMLRDYLTARTEATASGAPANLRRLRAEMGTDLLRAIVAQWFRSGVPLIVLLTMVVPLLVGVSVAAVLPRVRFELPMGTPDVEIIGAVLLASTAVIFIAVTIMLTVWVTPRIRPARPPRRPTC